MFAIETPGLPPRIWNAPNRAARGPRISLMRYGMFRGARARNAKDKQTPSAPAGQRKESIERAKNDQENADLQRPGRH